MGMMNVPYVRATCSCTTWYLVQKDLSYPQFSDQSFVLVEFFFFKYHTCIILGRHDESSGIVDRYCTYALYTW